MPEKKKIKVVWICSFANQIVRKKLGFRIHPVEKMIRRLMHVQTPEKPRDLAQWNTNAIKEIKAHKNVEVHVIAPWGYLPQQEVRFEDDGIRYYFFKDEGTTLVEFLKRNILGRECQYKKNSAYICRVIDEICPDIIHLMGAENPNYSSSVLHYTGKAPIIVQLQTLMSAPRFMDNYPISKSAYNYRSQIERKVLMRSDFIGTKGEIMKAEIQKNIKPHAIFFPLSLAVTEEPKTFDTEKVFDWVYFANGIEKAFDLVVEALGIVYKKYPSVKLNVVGAYTPDFKNRMEARLSKLHCLEAVSFTGCLPTHEDVLREVSRAKYAVLPLKVDILSGTIREAMALGLPIVTTITPRTPDLNKERQTLLLSEPGDHQALADNMMRLMEDGKLAATMQQNGYTYMKEVLPSNADRIKQWVRYYNCIINKKI